MDNILTDVSINSFEANLTADDYIREGGGGSGHSPYIGENGNWYEYNDATGVYVDTEVKAEGPQGPAGPAGQDGSDGAPGTPGTDGTDGYSPTVSTLAITGGTAVTITDVNGSHTFDVMDGANGRDGTNGTNGSDGVSPVVSISAITGGNAVTITDATHPSGQTFNVMNGQDGQDGSDYVLTAQDKDDIAQLVVGLIPEAEGSGF